MLAQIEEAVTMIMLELGVPVHLKGYQYVRTGIVWCVLDMERISSVTKLLYPELAKKYFTTPQKVERAIRNAVEVSWQRGNEELFESLFGYSRKDENLPIASILEAWRTIYSLPCERRVS